MNKELSDKLKKDFPKIFPDTFYFGCSDGWYDLINNLCVEIQKHCDNTPGTLQVVAAQVKEKFGGLRFYVDDSNEFADKLIATAESQSYKICEVCGKPGTLKGEFWISTLCEDHTRK